MTYVPCGGRARRLGIDHVRTHCDQVDTAASVGEAGRGIGIEDVDLEKWVVLSQIGRAHV